MSDLISRQAAIDAVKDCGDGHGFVWLDGVRAVLTLLPSVQPEQISRDIATIIENEQDMRIMLKNAESTQEQRWIPVTERLPEKPGIYLVTILNREWVKGDIVQGAKPPKDDHWESHANLYAERPDGKWVEVTQRAFTNSVRPTWSGYGEEVLAWMPLPEPYKEVK